MKKEKIIVYVDGFNLYFGMVEAGFDNYKWLNLQALIENFIRPNQEIIKIKYFTSRVSNNPDKQKRQTTYIEALETKGIEIYYGHYQRSFIKCYKCHHEWENYNEKMTDVNIATELLMDAFQDKYDRAFLISGDSDLVPPIKTVHHNFPNKNVFVLFPPKRVNNTVKIAAHGSLTIGRKKIKDSQFPNKVKKKNGFILKKPNYWE